MAKRKRAKRHRLQSPWDELLTSSATPLLLIDAERRITFANRALAEWVGRPMDRIIGRLVEYHSEPDLEDSEEGIEVISGLCPPPAGLAGNRVRGTLACVGRDGRLHHRRGEFLPIRVETGFAVLAMLEGADLTAEEMANLTTLSAESDFLHRRLRQLRREATGRYSVASLVGESTCMKRARAQVTAAARSRPNTLIVGPPGSGRSHLAKVIHYSKASNANAPLVELDCGILTEELLRKGLDSLHRESSTTATLLLIDIDRLETSFRIQVAELLLKLSSECQIIATMESDPPISPLDDELASQVGTVVVELIPLSKRREDIPLLIQYFLEEANVDSSRQVGSASAEVVERLALYSWPGEIAELRKVVHAAHVNCSGFELQITDLPAVVHHAAQAAQFLELPIERIALDEFLLGIERELVLRAMEQAQGNKALAARLLGMTRPRLYRRLVQLGLIGTSESDMKTEEDIADGSEATED